jgi:hypothetical protein
MANTYDQGDMVRLAATFEIETVDTDPSTITFKILAPDGTVTTYVFGTDVHEDRTQVQQHRGRPPSLYQAPTARPENPRASTGAA